MRAGRVGRGGIGWVGLAFACLYALSLGQGFYGSDGEVMFQTTAALVEREAWALPPDPGLPQIVSGAGGLFYAKYEPGLPLLSIPFYAAGDWLARVNHAHRATLAALAVLLLPALAAALTVATLCALASRLTSPPRAVWVALAAGLATPLWVYARTLFPEALLALALTGSAVLLATGRGSARRALAAGVLLGVGILTRAALAIYALPLAYVLLAARPVRGRDAAARLAAFALGALPFAAMVLASNALRFGDPFHTGYAGEAFSTPVLKGAAGLLISPGKSVFVFAPPLLLSAALWPRFRRAHPALGTFLALAWIVALPFYGAWWAWGGGWCWGPRLLVPLLPLSSLPLVALPSGRAWRIAAGALIALGAAVQILGVLTDVTPYYAGAGARSETTLAFRLDDAPLLAAARQAARGETEPLAAFHLRDSGLPRTWTVGAPALLLGGAAVGVWQWWRRALGRAARAHHRVTRLDGAASRRGSA